MKLMLPTKELEQSYIDYIEEWEKTGEKIVPYPSGRYGLEYDELLSNWSNDMKKETCKPGLVPATLYFLIDENSRIYGAIHIRHELNDRLLFSGGNIGYGIRPSERKKGYGAMMLAMALPYAKKLGITRALVTCDKDNIASARTIIKNGGILENEVIYDGKQVQRYWIEL